MADAKHTGEAQAEADDQLGTFPLSALTGRSSPSHEASKRQEIERDLALSPLQRAEKALRLGSELRAISLNHGLDRSTTASE